MTERQHCRLSETIRKAPGMNSHWQVFFVQCQRGGGCGDTPCHLKHCSDFWKVTNVMFIFEIVARYACDMHQLSVRRQAINRINDDLMSFEAWSTRFMVLNNNTLIFTKEHWFENVVCTVWAFCYRYQSARTKATRFPGLLCHQLFYNNPALV